MLNNNDYQSSDLYRIRHSAAHVMAEAVLTQFPDAKLAIGPPIEDGFYYDFDVDKPFSVEDLEKIEKEMEKIIKEQSTNDRKIDNLSMGKWGVEPTQVKKIEAEISLLQMKGEALAADFKKWLETKKACFR